jgi:hypothetical protein
MINGDFEVKDDDFGTEQDDLGSGSQEHLKKYSGEAVIVSVALTDKPTADPTFIGWKVVFQAPNGEVGTKRFQVPTVRPKYYKDGATTGTLFSALQVNELLKALGYAASTKKECWSVTLQNINKVFCADSPILGKKVHISTAFPKNKLMLSQEGPIFRLLTAEGVPWVLSEGKCYDVELKREKVDKNITFTAASSTEIKTRLATYGFDAKMVIGYYEINTVSPWEPSVVPVGSNDAHSALDDFLS